jgi:hypothetical protein
MRKLIVGVTTLALVVGAGWAGMAATAGGRTPVRCMDTAWRTTPVSTSSTDWTTVPGLTRAPVAIFPIDITVAATVSGAPAQFRVLSTNEGEQTFVSTPGPTRFDPGAGESSFAYQWIERHATGAAHSISLRLQWRSPSGNPVHMLRGDMSVLYASDGCTASA